MSRFEIIVYAIASALAVFPFVSVWRRGREERKRRERFPPAIRALFEPARGEIQQRLRQPEPQNELQEFSTNFNPDMVRPFLERIQPFIESGFGLVQIEQICQIVATLPHDEERSLEFQILHAGKSAPLRVQVVMDDINAPDIYFFSPPSLSQQIQSEFQRFAEERGI